VNGQVVNRTTLHESDLLLCRPAFFEGTIHGLQNGIIIAIAAALLAAPSARAQSAGEPAASG